MEEHFSVFSRKGVGERKVELVKHYETWGWLNFLSSMADTKVFDIPGGGLDSIECTKNAKAFKVLVYASEKKDLNAAMNEAYKT